MPSVDLQFRHDGDTFTRAVPAPFVRGGLALHREILYCLKGEAEPVYTSRPRTYAITVAKYGKTLLKGMAREEAERVMRALLAAGLDFTAEASAIVARVKEIKAIAERETGRSVAADGRIYGPFTLPKEEAHGPREV